MPSPPPLISDSPSFTTYSSENPADIAARVVEEFRHESHSDFDSIFGDYPPSDPNFDQDKEEETNDDFEFPSLIPDPNSPISADDIFYNGQIRPSYPVFDRQLLYAHLGNSPDEPISPAPADPPPPPVRAPLRKLFDEERDPANSCSSSEADELDGVAAGTYCVWKAKSAAEESPARCGKSNSTGSSKRWRFRSLIHRSNSDGKDTFVFLAPKSKKEEKPISPTTATEKKSSGDRKRSFLPYRQDLVGFFANRNLQPF